MLCLVLVGLCLEWQFGQFLGLMVAWKCRRLGLMAQQSPSSPNVIYIRSWCLYPHFTDGETGAQDRKSHSTGGARNKTLVGRILGSRIQALAHMAADIAIRESLLCWYELY